MPEKANGAEVSESFDRGPNGIPYIDLDRSTVNQWESGGYKLKIVREDGRVLNVNLSENAVGALSDATEAIIKANDQSEMDALAGDTDD